MADIHALADQPQTIVEPNWVDAMIVSAVAATIGDKSDVGYVSKHVQIETGDADVGHAVHETDEPKRLGADRSRAMSKRTSSRSIRLLCLSSFD